MGVDKLKVMPQQLPRHLFLLISPEIRKPRDPDLSYTSPAIFVKRKLFMSYTPGRQGLRGVSRPRAQTRQQCEFSRFVYSFAMVHFRKV